ncbi:hypothetical protein [Paraburkholderia sp. MM6662-R1]|uniref:hypothetical protein n=1 Tax=Paraburkholderia sp. MM6662-R1 TaxID=2991066 RepID=UPI003D1D039F
MNYQEFFRKASERQMRLPPPPARADYASTLDNEALFQLPLLAMVILGLSKGRAKPRTSELGQLVGECLERTVSGFKGSSQGIGWSANLRIRTVKALTFLERAGFAIVDVHNAVSATPAGRKIVVAVLDSGTPLAEALMNIERSYENIRAERRIREEV